MKSVFWVAAGLIAYAYVGYPLLLWILSRLRPKPWSRQDTLLPVSIVLAVRNESTVLPSKLENLRSLDYPADQLDIIVASDASTDGTDEILQQLSGPRFQFLRCSEHHGKAAALNQAIAVARGEVVVFTDARQIIEPGSIRRLVNNFADPRVGCVSGELMLKETTTDAPVSGLGFYWRLEKQIRYCESQIDSVAGATGALYAVRRDAVAKLPIGTILDDVYIPMHVVRNNLRVVFEPSARAWDSLSEVTQQEFRRKVRTLVGNYQLLKLAPWLLTPKNRILLQFVSHKLLRLLGPFLLAALLASSIMLSEGLYRIALVLQLAFYGLAAAALLRPKLRFIRQAADGAYAFILLNAAAMLAFVYFVTRKRGVWSR